MEEPEYRRQDKKMDDDLYKEWKKDRKKVRTYNQWLKAGRHVRKGEKHTGKNKDGYTFHISQTDVTLLLGSHPDPWADNGEEEAFFRSIDCYFDDIGDR